MVGQGVAPDLPVAEVQVAAGHELPSSLDADWRQVSHCTQRGEGQAHAAEGLPGAPVDDGDDRLVLIVDAVVDGLTFADELDDEYEGALDLHGVDAALGLDVPDVDMAALFLGGNDEEALVVVEGADLRAVREGRGVGLQQVLRGGVQILHHEVWTQAIEQLVIEVGEIVTPVYRPPAERLHELQIHPALRLVLDILEDVAQLLAEGLPVVDRQVKVLLAQEFSHLVFGLQGIGLMLEEVGRFLLDQLKLDDAVVPVPSDKQELAVFAGCHFEIGDGRGQGAVHPAQTHIGYSVLADLLGRV